MQKRQSIQMIADYDGDVKDLFDVKVDGEVPVLATRNVVLFPGVVTPVLIGRKKSAALIRKASKDDSLVFAVFNQKDESVVEPTEKDLNHTGVLARLVRVINIPGEENSQTAIIQAMGRCKLKKITKKRNYL